MCRKALCLMLFTVLFGAAARGADDVEWIRAAYYDARYPQQWSGGGESMRDGLQAAGYEILNADQLKTWMDARIADGKYSVVVFCRDIPPDTVAETSDANCTLRKYLDAGGKIVVYADIPFYNQGHADGSTTLWADAGSNNILGIGNVAVWDTNNTVTITAAGKRWGLTQTWSSIRPNAVGDVDIVLATDDSGNAAAWVKHYVAGDWFRGFVRLRDVSGQPPVEDVMRVAEYVGLKASDPQPANGATGVSMALMQWDAGSFALWHDIYFGTTPELGQADYKSQMPLQSAMYFHVLGLQPGTTYYWRIDEVEADGTVRTGDTWSFTATPQAAWAPEPADGARYVDAGTTLKWSPGMNATKRDVYFGADRAAVEAGTGDTAKGTQYPVTYDPAVLDRGVTYYWRIDEVAGASTATGDVWSFTVRPVIPQVDPTLVGWWKLEDEKSGTAVDYSGSDYYGELRGDPQWVEGYYGEALDFDGIDDFVNIAGPPDWPSGMEARTLCGWGKTDSVAAGYRWIAAYGSPGAGTAMFIGMNGTRLYGGGYGSDDIDVWVDGFWEVGVWHHICVTYDGTTARLYADGVEVASGSRTWDLVPSLAHIGRQVNSAAEFWDGMVDDVRVYNVALTPEEVKDVMRGDPLIAWDPQPKRGANVDIRDAAELSWSPGDTAAQHDVYFGTDRDAIKAADTGSAEYQARQAATSFSLAGLVDFGGGAYFWRVDEVEADGATVHRGSIWEFTIPDYLIVDEFETYTDDYEAGEAIWQAWIDGLTNGTGSIVGYFDAPFAEQTIVHSGAQSMPLDYNNVNSPYYSEAEREWTSAQDWTLYDVTDLSLWFQGSPVTAVETAAGQYRMSANSSDIWGAADNGRFMYKQLSGDGSISAKVLSVDYTAAWAKGGVMIRESLDPASSYAFMFPTLEGRRAFQNRPGTAAGAVSAHSDVGLVTLPFWVKVERNGSQFTAYYSENGTNWIQQPDTENTGGDASANPQTIIMPNTVYIGLALTSNNGRGGVCYAEFSEVNVTGSVSGQWKTADIGDVARGNDPAPFYLAVQDTSNKVGVVTHPDPTAVNLTEWTEWKIPVSQIPNANLTRVKKMYLGVGDRDNPTPDGTGLLFIDDIRVVGPADATP